MTYPLPRDTGKTRVFLDDAIDWLLEQKVAISPVAYCSYARNPAYRSDELMFVYFMAPADDPGVGEQSNAMLRNVATYSHCMNSVSIEAGMDGLGRGFGMPEKHTRRDFGDYILPRLALAQPELIRAAEAQATERSLKENQVISIWLGFRRGHLIVFVTSALEQKPLPGLSDCRIILHHNAYFNGEKLN